MGANKGTRQSNTVFETKLNFCYLDLRDTNLEPIISRTEEFHTYLVLDF